MKYDSIVRSKVTVADYGDSCVLLNPEFAASPVLKEFIFT